MSELNPFERIIIHNLSSMSDVNLLWEVREIMFAMQDIFRSQSPGSVSACDTKDGHTIIIRINKKSITFIGQGG